MEQAGHMREPDRNFGSRTGGENGVRRSCRGELLYELDTTLDSFAIWFLDRLAAREEAGR